MNFLVTVGEGIGNMVETTPMISLLAQKGDVDVWAKPTMPITESIINNRDYIRRLYHWHERPPNNYDKVFQTYSANSWKDPKFKQFKNVVEFRPKDAGLAQAIGEARGNLSLVLAQGWTFKSPAVSFVNIGTPKISEAVIFHPGAYNPSKQWPFFLELKEKIERNFTLKLFIFRDEMMSLPDVAATIKAAKLYVGNDSGPAHIAAAVRTTSIIIYGPTPISKNIPFHYECVRPLRQTKVPPCPCYPCIYQKARKDDCGYDCLFGLSVEEVFYEILDLNAGERP